MNFTGANVGAVVALLSISRLPLNVTVRSKNVVLFSGVQFGLILKYPGLSCRRFQNLSMDVALGPATNRSSLNLA